MTGLNFKDKCIQILATIPTIVFFIWSMYYCFHLFVGRDIPGVSPFSNLILGFVTLFMGIGGLVNLMKPNVDAVEFAVKTLCGLLAISVILFAEKFVDIAKIISNSL
ncbi:hypothetical protein [Bacillus sp. BPN334]|uniref:hypothetical protein n=1 Tax=Bacillus sp. BPN334 TaxID=2217815 RepID=UPI0011EDC175|nr:hypothetical protein [Bacillus sp. BPN334]KAA0794871.1 hypothetical protein DN393_00370 [Bacillus sp. BPN334]